MNHAANAAQNTFSTIIAFGVLALLVAATIAFFRGPARRSEEYANSISAQIPDPNDGALFLSLYRQKGAKNVIAAWLLSVFFSPTIAYLYLGENMKALLSFITLQGFFIWWIVSYFTMPIEALAKNKKAADDALVQLRLMRPQLYLNAAHAGQAPAAPGAFPHA